MGSRPILSFEFRGSESLWMTVTGLPFNFKSGCFRRTAATRRSHWVHLELEQMMAESQTLCGNRRG